MKKRFLATAAALAVGASGLVHAGSYVNDFSVGIGNADLRDSAALVAGAILLTDDINGQQGSLVIDNLDPGQIVRSFTATFQIAIAPGTDPIADGISFSFGPPPATSYGESGAPSGLVVVFDTHDNGEFPTPPAIRAVVNGVQVAGGTATLDSAGAFRTVTVELTPDRRLIFDFPGAGVQFNTELPGFSPTAGYQFTFGARTGDLNSVQQIDNVSITTSVATPAPVPTLGEWAMLGLATLLALFGAHTLRRRRATT